MKAAPVRECSVQEIERKLVEAYESHLKMRLYKQTSEVEKTHQFRERRRLIALLATLLREKKE